MKKRSETRARYLFREIALKRGWNIQHVSKGGDCLEENEIENSFSDIGLDKDKPDFLLCLQGQPSIVIEAKNNYKKIGTAVSEAIDYADKINKKGNYKIEIAVGFAGESDTGAHVRTMVLVDGEWVPLKSNGFEITTVPSKNETYLALSSKDGTTSVSVPDQNEFIDSAIELSKIFRSCKVEAPLRPKLVGSLVLALYQDNTNDINTIESINSLVKSAIKEITEISEDKKKLLLDTLLISGGDYTRLQSSLFRIFSILKGLNIKSVLQTDTDFLGIFYEAFLRYGYDNNALGIVFTPRHITNFCAELADVNQQDKIIDLASGTGGFLVAAFDRMMKENPSPRVKEHIKTSLSGFDTNPTVWALSILNMFFRGDGKSNIKFSDSLSKTSTNEVRSGYTKAFLNPPFSQEEEPEYLFINASMEALEPGGIFVGVVKTGIFCDDHHKIWRKEFLRKHKLISMITLPEDLFYPTSAPTSIIHAKAHMPMDDNDFVKMTRIVNDGYEKLKNRRIPKDGSQLPLVLDFVKNDTDKKKIGTYVAYKSIQNGEEWAPEKWLPQKVSKSDLLNFQSEALKNIFKAATTNPDLTTQVLHEFPAKVKDLKKVPLKTTESVEYFFSVLNGKSKGEKNYGSGETPYVSSGDSNNSIVNMIEGEKNEIFKDGGITVSAFGFASIQPWSFMARGNGGSSVRVLIPKYKMSFRELLWFAAQINSQRWRFHYSRMSIKSRISKLIVTSPDSYMHDEKKSIHGKITEFTKQLDQFCKI